MGIKIKQLDELIKAINRNAAAMEQLAAMAEGPTADVKVTTYVKDDDDNQEQVKASSVDQDDNSEVDDKPVTKKKTTKKVSKKKTTKKVSKKTTSKKKVEADDDSVEPITLASLKTKLEAYAAQTSVPVAQKLMEKHGKDPLLKRIKPENFDALNDALDAVLNK